MRSDLVGQAAGIVKLAERLKHFGRDFTFELAIFPETVENSLHQRSRISLFLLLHRRIGKDSDLGFEISALVVYLFKDDPLKSFG